jgi:hypothetical protein
MPGREPPFRIVLDHRHKHADALFGLLRSRTEWLCR